MFEHIPLVLAQEGDSDVPIVGNDQPITGDNDPTTTPPAGNGDPNAVEPGGGGGSFNFIIMMVLVLVIFYVFLFGGQRKEKKKRQAMLAALKKGDRVQTVGGIIGSVLEIRDNEVVVKVDENSNTRLRFGRAAIQSILEEKNG